MFLSKVDVLVSNVILKSENYIVLTLFLNNIWRKTAMLIKKFSSNIKNLFSSYSYPFYKYYTFNEEDVL